MSIYDDPGFVAWEELPSRQLHASLRSSYLAMAETGRSALVVFDDERPICLVTVGFIRRAWRAELGLGAEAEAPYQMPYEAIGGLRPLRTALDDWIKGPDARGAPDAQTRAVFPISPYRLDANIDLRELNDADFEVYPVESPAARGWYFRSSILSSRDHSQAAGDIRVYKRPH